VLSPIPTECIATMYLTCTGERKPHGYVGSAIQSEDLKVSGVKLMQTFQAFGQPSLLGTVKLHHVLAHAPADILAHGHEKHYSAQVPKGAVVIVALCTGFVSFAVTPDTAGCEADT